MLDSLVPGFDKIPETVRIPFLQRVVEKNQDLRQIHVLDYAWRSKTDSIRKFTFEVYYDLLWNSAYQHDLNNAAGQKKRQAFIFQQVESFDESDPDPGEDTYLIKMRMILPHPESFNLLSTLLNLENLPRVLSLTNFKESFLKLQRSLPLSTTRRLKWLALNHISMVTNLNLLWINPIQSPSNSTFKRMTIVLITLMLKILLKQWFMSL